MDQILKNISLLFYIESKLSLSKEKSAIIKLSPTVNIVEIVEQYRLKHFFERKCTMH